MDGKRCIFHLPFTPDPEGRPSGTNVRPPRMLQGFRDAGYEVFEIVGDSRERESRIAEARRQINAGVQFDFVYSESETIPTALTDSDHIPRHPFMDFSFFRFCRKNGIPVGLYLRDAHWRSQEYSYLRAGAKGKILTLLHWYDLKQYEHSIDALFIPSMEFVELLGGDLTNVRKIPLPSAVSVSSVRQMDALSPRRQANKQLHLAYVGGITVGEVYDLTILLKAVCEVEGSSLDLCVRKPDWERVQSYYDPLLSTHVRLHHVQGPSLKRILAQADVGMLYYPNSQYRALSMPTKIFEYLESGLPILTTKNSAAGRFVEQENCGWAIDFSQEDLVRELRYLCSHLTYVSSKKEYCRQVALENTWAVRAKQVAKALEETQAP